MIKKISEIPEKYIMFGIDINGKEDKVIKILKKNSNWKLLENKKDLDHGDVLLNRYENKILIGIALYNTTIQNEEIIIKTLLNILNTLTPTLESKEIAAIKTKKLFNDNIFGIKFEKIYELFKNHKLRFKLYEL
ncbi:hypothetical protein OSSY52_11920 [Tepiditoga spiralis]|uniref:Uncharacterized protein n=1 Tax=Tepiditoga spiralis TaxID=2108365 RepID=A0A7G1G3Z6_9BACT|nr:hypothetical protein [Tepiditoga spiralis]BBE31051.1 hypothetical protein OSSY52_11920 [Tepiditoga spiralis]